MTSSLPRRELERILDETLTLLNTSTMRRSIDDLLEAAASTFRRIDSMPAGDLNAVLLQTAGEFIAHLCLHDPACPRVLDPDQAKAQALHLLELAYRGSSADGFEGALRDTGKYGVQGLRAVLGALVDMVKQTQRQEYVFWVLETRIRQRSWSTQRDLAALILERWGALLDEDIARSSAADLAPACAQLILDYVASNESLRQVMGRPDRPAGAGRHP